MASINSTYNRVDWVAVKEGRGVVAKRPAFQVSSLHTHSSSWPRFPFNQVPINLFRNNGNPYTATIPGDQFSMIKHATLHVRIKVNSAVKLAPMPYWFNRVSLSQPGGESLVEIRGDSLAFNTMAAMREGSIRGILRNICLNNDPNYLYGESSTLPSGSCVDYFLPLLGLWWNSAPHFTNGDLVLKLDPANSIAAEGTAADVDVLEMGLIFEGEKMDTLDRLVHMNERKQAPHANIFLEPVEHDFPNQALSAGNQTTLDLSAVLGKIAFLTVLVRAAGESEDRTDNKCYRFLDLGDSADSVHSTMDLVNSSGSSLWGDGQPVSCKFMRNELWNHHIMNTYAQNKAVYMMPFTENALGAFQGRMDGYYAFDGSQRLAIRPGAALVNEVQRVTFFAAPAGGYFRLAYKNSMSAPLASNTSAALLKAAFDKLQDARREGVTATFSAGLSTANIDITLSGAYQTRQGDYGLVTILGDGGAATAGTTTVLTPGNNGFTSGNYHVRVIAYRFKQLVTHDNRISASII